MAQQINLLTLLLRPPALLFSALAMGKAVALLTLGAMALAIFLNLQAKAARAEDRAQQRQMASESQQLKATLASLPAAVDARALQQQFDAGQQQLEAQRRMLALLKGGLTADGQRHSDLLQLLAATVPPQVWLTELRWQTGQLELDGATLETRVLQAWLERLSAHPLLQGLQLTAIKVEKASPATAPASPSPSSSSGPSNTNSWNFTLRSQAPAEVGTPAAPAMSAVSAMARPATPPIAKP